VRLNAQDGESFVSFRAATFREWLKALKRRNRLVATFGLKCAGKEKPPEGGFESLA
jgi:hypothetical protein